MTSPPSGSDGGSQAFASLHPAMQRWVYDRGWTSLHDAQERAIGPILAGRDVIISAATAAGKTEAAFLPICSALATARDEQTAPAPDPWTAHDPWAEPTPTVAQAAPGIEVLYVSPLKALINDQYERLIALSERAEIAVSRWHGDVDGSAKRKTLEAPSGVLLITPESLEATFVNRGHEIGRLLGGLRYIVVDELHSFLDSPRGAQLTSLLNRVELAIRRRPPRIGLSATLGDMNATKGFLCPTDPAAVIDVTASGTGELRLQVRGYRQAPPELTPRDAAAAEASGAEVEIDDVTNGDKVAIAEHLYATLHGSDNLVFANARQDVEVYADLLARRCEADRVPNAFWATTVRSPKTSAKSSKRS